MSGLNFGLEESLKAAVGAGFKLADYQEFKDSLSASRQIVYIADNAGEVVFDRLLLEEIYVNKKCDGCASGTDVAASARLEKLRSKGRPRPILECAMG
jgi:uncharacterized protein with ATP-grasp and redox domains